MDEKTAKDILSTEYDKAKPAAISALIKGERVEMLKDKDGKIIAQTIQRKRLKLNNAPTA